MGANIEQDNNGRWNIKVKHNGPDTVQIPVTLTYEGIECNFDCKSSEQTIPTDWETEAGKTIDTNKISLNSEEVVKGNCIYHVDGIKWNNVQPFSGKTYELEVTSDENIIQSDGTTMLYARYTYSVEGEPETQKLVDNESIVWTNSNPDIITISDDGTVTAKNTSSEGTTVTITGTYGDVKGTTKITVGGVENATDGSSSGSTSGGTATIEPTGITISNIPKQSYDLHTYADLAKQFKATVWPTNASNKNVIWESSDNSIVTVNNKGTVEVSHNPTVGSAVITVYTYDRKFSDSRTVNVLRQGTIVTAATPTTVNLPTEGGDFTVTVSTVDFGLESGWQDSVNPSNTATMPSIAREKSGNTITYHMGENKYDEIDTVIWFNGMFSDDDGVTIDYHQDPFKGVRGIWNAEYGDDVFYRTKGGACYFEQNEEGKSIGGGNCVELLCVPRYIDEILADAATTMPDWIHFGQHGVTSGSKVETRVWVGIFTDENNTGSPRTGYVNFRGGVTLTVKQKG